MEHRVLCCVPVRVAAIISALSVLIISALGAAAGWYAIYAIDHVSGYTKNSSRTKAFAGVLGTLALVVACVSCYGLFALVTKRRLAVQNYLWSSWITFFLTIFVVTSFALLIWFDDVWPRLWTRVVSSVVAGFGLFVQLYLTVLLRLHYEEMQSRRVRTKTEGRDLENSCEQDRPYDDEASRQ